MKLTPYLKPRYLFLFVLIFLGTLKSHRTYLGQGDEPHYLVAAESLAFDFDLDLRNNYNSPYLRAFKETDYHALPKADGALSPFHSIGLSILLVPSAYLARAVIRAFGPMDQTQSWIASKNTASFTMMALAALFAVLFMKFFIRLGFDPDFSFFLGGFFMITPSLLNYSFLLFPALPTAFIIFHLLSRLAQKEFGLLDQILIGFLPWLSPRNYLVSGIFLLLFLWVKRPSKEEIVSAKSVEVLFTHTWLTTLFWAAIFFINFRMWGSLSPASPWTNTGHSVFNPAFLPKAIPGLFFDRSYGLLIYAPIYFLFPAGLYFMYRKNRPFFWKVAALLAAVLISISGYWDWKGGWSPGPRYLTPAVPFLAVGLAYLLREFWRYPQRNRILGFLMGGSAILSLLYWQDPRALWPGYVEPDVATGQNRFLAAWFGSLGPVLQGFFPNMVYPKPIEFLKLAAHLAFISWLNFSLVAWMRKRKRTS